MAIDPKRVKAIFLEAAELPDEAARAAFLDRTCGGDAGLRERVEVLLRSHDPDGSFLGTPAAVVPDPDYAGTAAYDSSDPGAGPAKPDADDESDDLKFLTPPGRPDSLGRIGHYEVLQVLGKGGFGIVFRAFDDMLQRVVAVKVMAPQIAVLSPARKRFLREARSSAAVRHENVVGIHEVGDHPLPYLVMEFVPGETLQQRLNRCGPLDVPEVVRIGRQIAEGLSAAHASDLIHRDIKPGNVLLEGGSQKVKITDFGLARAADDASISQSGIIAGTPMYMAPEQALGQDLDQRADLFSLGSVLYQMAAGRAPFRADSTVAVLKRVAEDTPRGIRAIIPETPQWLCDIIAKLHAKNPDDRYQSAREVADVLADCEAQLKANSKLQDFSRIPRGKAQPSGRRKWVAAAAVLLLPVIALAVTESAGVTQLFRGRPAANAPVPGGEPPPVVAKQDPTSADGFMPLFNGKDLSGWKTHPDRPGGWAVEDGTLVARAGELSHLFTDRGDYENFHLRAEVRVSGTHSAALDFRSEFGFGFDLARVGDGAKSSIPVGYEVQIACGGGQPFPTGTLTRLTPAEVGHSRHLPVSDESKADAWVLLEVVARGDQITILVDRKVVVEYREVTSFRRRGHLALQTWWGGTVVRFRKIEIKEMPADPAVKQASLPPAFTNSLGMEFVIVPKGKSWLGGSKDRLGSREVEVPADFYLGKYEVTQEEWEKVMGQNPSHFSRTGDGKDAMKDISDADLKRFPLENASWDQCQMFLAKLNEREKETGWVYRLPTAVEWEYACRGGPMADKADSAFDFYFARPTNTLSPEQANFSETELKRTCTVGSYPPNALGLYDLHGNVWEWCDDKHKTTTEVSARKILGACFLVGSVGCRTVNCSRDATSLRYSGLGLRLARVPAVAPSPEAKTLPSGKPDATAGSAFFNGQDLSGWAPVPDTGGRWTVEAGELRGAWGPGEKPVVSPALRSLETYRDFELSFELRGEPRGPGGGLRGYPLCALLVRSEWPIGVRCNFGNPDFGTVNPRSVGTTALGNAAARMPGPEFEAVTVRCVGQRVTVAVNGVVTADETLKIPAEGHIVWMFGYGVGGITVRNVVFRDLGLARVPSGAPSPEAKTPPVAVAPFTDADVRRIAALPATEQVEEVRKELMRRNPGFDGTVGHKIDGDKVTELRIVTDKVTDISPIRVFGSLRVLDLYATHTNNYEGNGLLADLSPLAGMNLSGLTRLNLSFTMVGDAGLVHFKGCTNLTYLSLDSTQVSDAGLAYFKNCTNLSQLILGRTKVNAAGLAHFKNCKKLTLLDLSKVSVGDAELGYFAECEHLTRLGLGRTQVTDAGLAHFKNCKKLQHVNLLATQVGNVGLAYLKDCKELTGLFIGATKVTDLSLIKDLPLKELDFDFRPERDAEILRSIKTLETINRKPADQFWKGVE